MEIQRKTIAVLAGLAASALMPMPLAAQEWVPCAQEGERCDFAGTKIVLYSFEGQHRFGTYTDGVSCSNAEFGDPAPGRRKSCAYWLTAAVAQEEEEVERLRAQLQARDNRIQDLESELAAQDDRIGQLRQRVRRTRQRLRRMRRQMRRSYDFRGGG